MRELVLYKSCSIIKGMMDAGMLPNVSFPLKLTTNKKQLMVEYEDQFFVFQI